MDQSEVCSGSEGQEMHSVGICREIIEYLQASDRGTNNATKDLNSCFDVNYHANQPCSGMVVSINSNNDKKFYDLAKFLYH
jgi:hypothetical protein